MERSTGNELESPFLSGAGDMNFSYIAAGLGAPNNIGTLVNRTSRWLLQPCSKMSHLSGPTLVASRRGYSPLASLIPSARGFWEPARN
jgi:hypothetical protein